MMHQYSFFAPLWRSWWPGNLYPDVAYSRRGGGAWWLFVLTVLCSVGLAYGIRAPLLAMVDELVPELFKQMPEVHIANGTISTPNNKTVLVRGPEKLGSPIWVAIFPMSDEAPAEYRAVPVVALRSKVVTQSPGRPPQEFPYGKMQPVVINEQTVTDGAKKMISILPWTMLPFTIVGWYISHLIMWLLLSIVAAIGSAIGGGGLGYGAMLRITSRAMTPGAILTTAAYITLFANPTALFGGLGLIFLYTLLLVLLAARAAAKDVPAAGAPGAPASATPAPPMPGML